MVVALHAGSAAGQFNAKGRRRPPPTTTPAPAGARANAGASTPGARADAAAPAAPETPSSRRDILIVRYEKLLLEEPGQPAVLDRLIELIRERDGNLQHLRSWLVTQAGSDDSTGYAATLALASLAELEGDQAQAEREFGRAHQKAPRRPEALLGRARLEQQRGDLASARRTLEQALGLGSELDQQTTLRRLRDLSLDLGELDAAREYHRKLSEGARGNRYLRSELARELLRRGRAEDAVLENQRLLQSAAGDQRALAPLLRDLGEAQIAASQLEEAKKSLSRAHQLSSAQPGLRQQIDALLAEAHQRAGSLESYLAQLAATATTSSQLMLVGRLREQRGETELAIEAYRRAARLSPRDPDPLLSLVRLLELTSELGDAAEQYAKITRLAPQQLDLSLRYMDLLLAQGHKTEALREFDRAARLAATDPEAALLLVDFAERIGERARASSLRQTVEGKASLDAHQLVELGSRAYRDGEKERASALWKRILTAPGRPEVLHVTYGETLLGHEQISEGISALERAVALAPGDPETRRALARGLLRAAAQSTGSSKNRYELASLDLWKSLLTVGTSEPADQSRRAEARRQVVRLYERTGQLDAEIARLHRRFAQHPGDLETGRLLALAQLERGRLGEAEATLADMTATAPADRETLQLLDRVQMQQGKIRESMVIKQRLIELDPSHAPELYQELSERALLLQDDALAIRYAELSLERDQGSADAQARLGDLYAKQGKAELAAQAYRAALRKNDRLSAVALRLAGLLAKQGKGQEALDLSLRVLRTSREEAELAEAGRTALTLGLSLGRARQLEDELRPLAIGMPENRTYQALLLEVMTAELTPLKWQVQFGEADQAAVARRELAALSDRCLPSLLVALTRGEASEQQRAIAILGYGTSESSGAALLEFAQGAAPESLRLEATLAAGRQADPRLVPRLLKLIANEGTTLHGRVPRAALISLSAIPTSEARRGVKLAVASSDPDLRVEAILALADSPALLSTRELIELLSSSGSGPSPRAAAALALGGRPPTPQTDQALRRAAEDNHRLVRAAGLRALRRAHPDAAQPAELATRALFERDAQLSGVALATLTLTRETPAQSSAPSLAQRLELETLHLPAEQLIWARLIGKPGAEARVRALVAHQGAIQSSLTLGLRMSQGSALLVLESLRQVSGAASLLPLYDARRDSPELSAELNLAGQKASQEIRQALLPAILSHAGGPDPQTQSAALRTLTLEDGPAARLAIVSGLSAEEPSVFEAALDALSRSSPEGAVTEVRRLVNRSQSWHRMRRIAELLERVALAEGGSSRKEARALLAQLSETSEGLARERALSALKAIDQAGLADP